MPFNSDRLIDILNNVEDQLSEEIMTEQDICERHSGKDIVFPEDAAPELDSARGFVRDAIMALQDYQEFNQ